MDESVQVFNGQLMENVGGMWVPIDNAADMFYCASCE